MLIKCIKTELRKALRSPMFVLALLAGGALALGDAVYNSSNIQQFAAFVEGAASMGVTKFSLDHIGYSLFALAMPYDGGNFSGMLFLFIWPVLAAMPYGWSYCQERRNGLSNQIISRCGARRYFVSKYVAVFVSGGLAVSLPLLLNLLANAMVLPYSEMSPLILPAINSQSFLAELYFTCAWAHGLVWCCVVFLLGGATACLCFCVGTWLRLQVVVTLVPFAILVVFDQVFDFVCIQLWGTLVRGISPQNLVFAVNAMEESVTFAVIGVLAAVAFAAGYWQVVKHELA